MEIQLRINAPQLLLLIGLLVLPVKSLCLFIASYSYKLLIANVLSKKALFCKFVTPCICRLRPHIIKITTDLGGLALE